MSDGSGKWFALGCGAAAGVSIVGLVALPLLGCLGFIGGTLTGTYPPSEVVRGDQLPSERMERFREDVLEPGESLQFIVIDSPTVWFGEGGALTDRRVLVFWADQDGRVHAEGLPVTAIADVRVEPRTWPDDPLVRVTSTEGHELAFEVPETDLGSERIIRALRNHVPRAAPPTAPAPAAPEEVPGPTADTPESAPAPAEAPAAVSGGPRGSQVP